MFGGDPITFASLLTADGLAVAATIVTMFISLVKTAVPKADKLDGALSAFALTAFLYVLAGIAVGVSTLDMGLAVFVAWLGCATSAVGIHKMIVKPVVEQIRGD